MRALALSALIVGGAVGAPQDVTSKTESYMLTGRLGKDDLQWLSEGTAVIVSSGQDFYTTGGIEPQWKWRFSSYSTKTVCRSDSKCISKAEMWSNAKRFFLHGQFASVVVNPATQESQVCVDKGGEPLRFFRMRPHPTKVDQVLGLRFFPNCTYSSDLGCPYQIYLSKDTGVTFDLLRPSAGVPDTWVVDWAPKQQGSHYDDTRILLIRQDASPGTQMRERPKGLYRWSYKTGPTDQGEQDWTGVQWAPQLKNAVYFVKTGKNFVFGAVIVQNVIQLWVRPPGAQSFVQSHFPPPAMQEKSYTVLDSSEGTVFVNVYHQSCPQCKSSHWGHLYISDQRGEFYQYSLLYNRRNPGGIYGNGGDAGTCDFHKVHGLQGVYMASRIRTYNNRIPDECVYCEHPNNDDRTPCVKACKYETVMTWYKGEVTSWDLLEPPTETVKNEQIDYCKGSKDCHLHLHGYASGQDFIAGPLSRDDAPGLIIASGNVGEYLDVDGVTVDVFLSKDAGLTWRRVAEGPHAYDWIDYGGFIALAKTQEDTDSFTYTADGGLTWKVAQFSSKKVRVRNLRLMGGKEYNDQRKPLLLIETLAEDTETQHTTLYRVNVSDISYYLAGFCQKPEDAELDMPNSNYESFHPRARFVQRTGGPSTEECFLGVREMFIRRKPGSQCWSDLTSETVESPRQVIPCACKREDFDCDAGYELLDGSDKCVPSAGTVPSVVPPTLCDSVWSLTKGYVRVPGDLCDANAGVEKWDADIMPCPGNTGGSSSGGSGVLTFFIIVIFIAGGGYASWWLYNNNHDCADMVNRAWSTVAGLAAGVRVSPGGGGGYSAVQTHEGEGDSPRDAHLDSDPDEVDGPYWRGVPNGTEREHEYRQDIAPAPVPPAAPPTETTATPVAGAVLSQAPPAPTMSAVPQTEAESSPPPPPPPATSAPTAAPTDTAAQELDDIFS